MGRVNAFCGETWIATCLKHRWADILKGLLYACIIIIFRVRNILYMRPWSLRRASNWIRVAQMVCYETQICTHFSQKLSHILSLSSSGFLFVTWNVKWVKKDLHMKQLIKVKMSSPEENTHMHTQSVHICTLRECGDITKHRSTKLRGSFASSHHYFI